MVNNDPTNATDQPKPFSVKTLTAGDKLRLYSVHKFVVHARKEDMGVASLVLMAISCSPHFEYACHVGYTAVISLQRNCF